MFPRVDPVVWPDTNEKWKDGPLSVNQLEHYNSKGYVLLDKVFSGKELQHLQEVSDTIGEQYRAALEANADARINYESKMVAEQEGRKV